MSEQENIQTIRIVFDNLNKHNLDANNQFLADDVRTEATAAPGVMNTREQGQMYTQLFLEAFPDLHFDLKDVIAQGDKAAVSWVAKGTHTAPMRTPGGESVPATNKRITVPGSTIYEFRNNLIARQEIYWDQVNFLTQLELMGAQQISRSGR